MWSAGGHRKRRADAALYARRLAVVIARRAGASAALMCALLAGCGARDDTSQTTPADRTIRAEAPAPTRITSPRDSATAPATRSSRQLVADLVVRGRAQPDAAILVASQCLMPGCETLAHADEHGRWSAQLRVAAAARRPRVAVVARAVEGDTRPATVRVRLTDGTRAAARRRAGRAPRRARAPAQRRDAAPPAAATPRASGGTPAPSGPPPSAPAEAAAPRTLIVIGDSLAEGTAAVLPSLLPGWDVRTDARRGRPLAEGMAVLSSVAPPPRAVLAFSLFTNDDPRRVDALEASVRASVERAGARGCAIWATIVRPPLSGATYDAANERLERLAGERGLAGRLLVVAWARTVAAGPQLLAPDGVHATAAGYATRARMYADAAASCRR